MKRETCPQCHDAGLKCPGCGRMMVRPEDNHGGPTLGERLDEIGESWTLSKAGAGAPTRATHECALTVDGREYHGTGTSPGVAAMRAMGRAAAYRAGIKGMRATGAAG